ncbi:MAG TPA: DUF2784 domain-containing protein [Burkholderiaceae bacterium]|nr:DUF2784 domain-containing protein [Burkholderiaceae bacterium]
MLTLFAADVILLAHAAFILFVVLGGLLVLRFRKLKWIHLAAVAWGAMIEFSGWICPLTPLENMLRRSAGAKGYSGGFFEHYVLALIYPSDLSRQLQVVLGLAVLGLNALIYGLLLRRRSVR